MVDELLQLWNDGVITYDASKKQNFRLRAALMWIINDFPTYGMLSRWSTAGKFACPICMNKSKAFSLKNGRKVTWFDCHRQFLPYNHVLRRNKKAFYKSRIENKDPRQRLSGEQVYEMVSSIPKSTGVRICNVIGHGHSHNMTKRSIF